MLWFKDFGLNQAYHVGRYTGTIDVLYCSNSFIVFNLEVMYHLPLILLHQRINSIRSLRFEWVPESSRLSPPLGPQPGHAADVQEDQVQRDRWTTIWDVIASMQSLQDLYVVLRVNVNTWGSLNTESAKILLQPIRKVTGPANFTLALPFPAMDDRKPEPLLSYSWSAVEGWQGVDPWEELPCKIRRVNGNS